jgi:hypothetical protein
VAHPCISIYLRDVDMACDFVYSKGPGNILWTVTARVHRKCFKSVHGYLSFIHFPQFHRFKLRLFNDATLTRLKQGDALLQLLRNIPL